MITSEQKKEIGLLCAEHEDTLIAFGSDLYNQGLKEGFLMGCAGIGIGFASGIIVNQLHEEKLSKKELES